MAKKILIIENQADTSREFNMQMSGQGYVTVFDADGASAIAIALNEKPDLVLLDIDLPTGDGLAILQCLKSSPRTMRIPIIVISVRDPVTHQQRSLELGAAGYFQKPADTEQLLAAIHKELGEEGKTKTKGKILIIEDDPRFRQALNIRLHSDGYETAFASDALEAMTAALQSKPDLIILDLGLPAGNGLAVLEHIKHNASLSPIPVIIVTGWELHEASPAALGACGYFQKPVDPEELLAAIRKALEGTHDSSPKP